MKLNIKTYLSAIILTGTLFCLQSCASSKCDCPHVQNTADQPTEHCV